MAQDIDASAIAALASRLQECSDLLVGLASADPAGDVERNEIDGLISKATAAASTARYLLTVAHDTATGARVHVGTAQIKVYGEDRTHDIERWGRRE